MKGLMYRRLRDGLVASLLAQTPAIAMSTIEVPLFRSGMESCEIGEAPVANAGRDLVGGLASPQGLDGRGSCDPQGLPLSYDWSLVQEPAAQSGRLENVRQSIATLTPALHGEYRVELRVSNGRETSAPDSVLIRAFRNFGIDSDEDELSDALERALGLDPYEADTFGDGIRDGNRDLDLDGLTILQELLLATDPINADTDGDGVNDGAEDFDIDGLTNVLEFANGASPLSRDTDGDGWIDGAEVDGGSNPADPASTPRLLINAQTGLLLVRPGQGDAGGLLANTVVSAPVGGHGLTRPGLGEAGNLPTNTVVSSPFQGHGLTRPGLGEAGSLPNNTVVSAPPAGHALIRPGIGEDGGLSANTVVAQPPASLRRPQ